MKILTEVRTVISSVSRVNEALSAPYATFTSEKSSVKPMYVAYA